MESKKPTRAEKIAQGIAKPFKGEGNRKARASRARKDQDKTRAFGSLEKKNTSPRKMRLVVDLVRGKTLDYALNILKISTKHAARDLRKLLISVYNNYNQKFESKVEPEALYVKTAYVDSAAMLKRILPAPQGRAYQMRKRSHHLTVELDLVSNKPDLIKEKKIFKGRKAETN
jgi:large subunit ribosomal protein L22